MIRKPQEGCKQREDSGLTGWKVGHPRERDGRRPSDACARTTRPPPKPVLTTVSQPGRAGPALTERIFHSKGRKGRSHRSAQSPRKAPPASLGTSFRVHTPAGPLCLLWLHSLPCPLDMRAGLPSGLCNAFSSPGCPQPGPYHLHDSSQMSPPN